MEQEVDGVIVGESDGLTSMSGINVEMEQESSTHFDWIGIREGIILSLEVSFLLTAGLYLIYILIYKHNNYPWKSWLWWIIVFMIICGFNFLRWHNYNC